MPLITQTHTCSEFYDFGGQPVRPSKHNESRLKTDKSWTGTRSYADAQELARKGWPEGTTRAYKLANIMSAELVASVARPEITFDVTGEMFDMGRVMGGEPECWMQWVDGQEDGGKPIHIVSNGFISSGINHDAIMMRGAALTALIIVLEAAGRPCRIEVAGTGQDGYGRRSDAPILEPRIILKDYYDPIQIDAVAYALIHPSFFRRHIFAAYEAMGLQQSFYCMPVDAQGPHGDIYLGNMTYGDAQWGSESAALAWVKTQLKLQGVTFTGGL